MPKPPSSSLSTSSAVAVVIRKTIAATAEILFDAWTKPAKMKEWWGPGEVRCVDVEVDLRVGGRYRIANQFPDGKVIWISGEYESIERPHKLVYTWVVEPNVEPIERVTVQFKSRDRATEVIIIHEQIPDASTRDRHEAGWHGCLEGLANYASRARH
jgi:uncharacterized protein YndB with AHSA1/START domain